MPFGAIKDLVSRGGRKAAKSGKKAAMKAKEYDQKMVEAHSDNEKSSDVFGLGGRNGGSTPEIDLGVSDDPQSNASTRYENQPQFGALGPTDDEDTDTPRIGELGFAGERDDDNDDWMW